MALSPRGRKYARRLMQLFTILGAVTFFAQCAEQARPYLRVIMGKQHASHEPGER